MEWKDECRISRQTAIKCLEMFLDKQCDLERTKARGFSDNDIWAAVKMAYDALSDEKVAKRMTEKLKPCPFRVHGERTASWTVAGEYYYNETFMPCMRDECAAYWNGTCMRDGANFAMLKGEEG